MSAFIATFRCIINLISISMWSRRKVVRINKWSLEEICFDLLTNSLHQFFKKCMEASVENLYVDLEAWVNNRVLYSDSNFWIWEQNPAVWPFKWNLFASTFTRCNLFFSILQIEIWKVCWILTLATFGSERSSLRFF